VRIAVEKIFLEKKMRMPAATTSPYNAARNWRIVGEAEHASGRCSPP
jgi:hypothetical protein